jgi:transposase
MPKNLKRREEFLKLYEKGFKDSEIAKILEVGECSINKIRWEFKLPPNGRGLMTDDEFIEAVKEGLITSQICEKFGVSDSAVYRRSKKLNVPLNKKEITKKEPEKVEESKKSSRKIEDVDFLKQHSLGMTDKELSEYFSVANSTVKQYRYRLNLPFNKKKVNNEVIPNNEEFQVLYGTILGDAFISEGRYENGDSCGSFNHCVEQKEWIFKKFEYLNRFCNPPKLIDKYDERFKTPEYQQYYCYIKTNSYLSELYPKLYNNGIKYIDEETFSKIDALGIATWYMDDGSKSKDSKTYVFCTHSFSDNDMAIIQKVLLNKFSIDTTVQSSKMLRIRSNSILMQVLL